MKILKDYVYRSIADFGNSFIMPLIYKQFGEEAILNDLKENGFNCIIEKRQCEDNKFGMKLENRRQRKQRKKVEKEIIYVITDKRRFKDEH